MIVDDHLISGLGTKALLMSYPDINIVEIARSADEAKNYLQSNEVDVVLLDLYMPQVDGFEVLKMLKLTYSRIKVIILTSSEEKENILKAIKLDADGYIFKDTSQEELSNGIRKVFSGKPAFNGRTFEMIFEDIKMSLKKRVVTHEIINNRLDEQRIKSLITQRELDVLLMLGNKKSTSEVAEELGISKYTVNTYRKNLNSKLNVHNVKELLVIAKAMRNNNHEHL